MIHIV